MSKWFSPKNTPTNKKTIRFSPSTKSQSFCPNEEKPNFGKNRLSFLSYIQSFLKHSTYKQYGCKKYIKYIDGHYCCVDKKPTLEEMIDFIDMCIISFYENVGYTNSADSLTEQKYEAQLKNFSVLIAARRIINRNLSTSKEFEYFDHNNVKVDLDEISKRVKERFPDYVYDDSEMRELMEFNASLTPIEERKLNKMLHKRKLPDIYSEWDNQYNPEPKRPYSAGKRKTKKRTTSKRKTKKG